MSLCFATFLAGLSRYVSREMLVSFLGGGMLVSLPWWRDVGKLTLVEGRW